MSKYSKKMADLKKLDKKYDKLGINSLKIFKEKLKNLQDERQKAKCTYKIWDVVTYVFIATLSGQDTWEDIHDFVESKYDFFRSFLLMTGGVPNAKTISRIFSKLKPESLEYYVKVFFDDCIKTNDNYCRDVLALDGKQDNGSGRNANEIRAAVENLNVLNVYSNNDNFCIGSMMIADKSNEIPAGPKLLKLLNIKDAIVTSDALNTQKKTAEAIIQGGADYVLALKKNHHTFYDELELYFNDKKIESMRASEGNRSYKKEISKESAGVITREYFHTEDISWFQDSNEWTDLRSFGLVIKTIEKGGKTVIEKRYYISSLLLDVVSLANAIRKHWGVEGKLHFHLDVTFNLDKNTTMNKTALMNLGPVKKLCIPMIKKGADKYEISSRRMRNLLSFDFENQISTFFNVIIK